MERMKNRHFGPISLIPGERRGAYPFCHSVFIEGAGVLIDPSSDREELVRLRQDRRVKAVWLTHWHEDHWLHLDLFQDLPLWMSRPDSLPMADIELFLDWYGIPPERPDMRDDFRELLRKQFSFRARRPARFLEPGESVRLESVEVEVVHTPGHTPGHLAFFFREPEVLFLGDYDLTRFGPWYGDLHSSLEETLASVGKLRRLPARVWLSSHGPGVFEQEPGELWDSYLGAIQTREEKLLSLLAAGPRRMEEIVEAWIVYGKAREPRLFFEFGERAILSKHLKKLQEQGRVVCEGGCYHAL